MLFSIVVIAKNESKNIPVLANSATTYLKNGGKILLFDTGSTDNTVQISRDLGFDTIVSSDSFIKTLPKKRYVRWKKSNQITSNPTKTPVKFFAFDEARNAAASLASTDIVFFMDGCDSFVNFDFETINQYINEGYERFSVTQLYGDMEGKISRFYNKKKARWIGHVHEHITNISLENVKCFDIPKSVLCISHTFVQKDRSSSYIAGLIDTHIKTPTARWYYYIARELHFQGYHTDAISMFEKCFNATKWPEEKAACMCISAKCATALKLPKEDVFKYYERAYNVGSTLKEPCFEMAQYSLETSNWNALLESASKGLTLISKKGGFFEHSRFYEEKNLYYYLYIAHWWTGNKCMSVYYWNKYCTEHNVDKLQNDHFKFFRDIEHTTSPPYTIKSVEYSNYIINTIVLPEERCLASQTEREVIAALKPNHRSNIEGIMLGGSELLAVCMSIAYSGCTLYTNDSDHSKRVSATSFVNNVNVSITDILPRINKECFVYVCSEYKGRLPKDLNFAGVVITGNQDTRELSNLLLYTHDKEKSSNNTVIFRSKDL